MSHAVKIAQIAGALAASLTRSEWLADEWERAYVSVPRIRQADYSNVSFATVLSAANIMFSLKQMVIVKAERAYGFAVEATFLEELTHSLQLAHRVTLGLRSSR